MQNAAELRANSLFVSEELRPGAKFFVVTVLGCILLSAILAGFLPLQVSIVTVFLFAGPHNWSELRYFLMRLPVRFGRSRNFFLTAFFGIGLLAISYISLPFLYRSQLWSEEGWLSVIGAWNSLLLAWLGALIWLRGKQKTSADWTWMLPILLALGAVNWLAPQLFSLALVYIHPLIALWFLDRHLKRNRPHWLAIYRRCLVLVPLVLCLMVWQLATTSSLPEDNGLFWRITQHSGAELLPGVSSHMLVSIHLFLEMLHYGVWLVALPLLGPVIVSRLRSTNMYSRWWDLNSLPLARHPRGFPKLMAVMLGLGVLLVLLLWVGFSVDYATTRDIYFTVAIAHVIAEAPFLMRML